MTIYDDVLAALALSSAYPEPAQPVQHLQTHISDVFLAGHYAYKLKKPVDLGFLDFRSLARRRAACVDEVRLNRRLAPDIYLDVVPICTGTHGYRIDGCDDDHAVEYAVRMRRLPQHGLLDRLADRGRLTTAMLRGAAATIAGFHARAGRGPEIDIQGETANIAARIDQNFLQTAPFVGALFAADDYSRLARDFAHFLDAHADLFTRRIHEGRIVDGHGDLHLRNMCLYRGQVVIFDCIEFSQAYRAGDVINDVAFLTMDLRARGLHALATDFMNEYLEHTQDYGGLALLDFYEAYRAQVRAKVEALTATADTGAAAARARAAARHYLAQALRSFAPRHGGIAITAGVSGSGKSTIARSLAREIDSVVVRSDAVRKHLSGIGRTRAANAIGAGIYAEATSERTYDNLLAHATDIAVQGRWAILDATYATRDRRGTVSRRARDLGVPFVILHCTAPRAELERRITRRAQTGDLSDAGIEVLRAQLPLFETPRPEEGHVLTVRDLEDARMIAPALAQLIGATR